MGVVAGEEVLQSNLLPTGQRRWGVPVMLSLADVVERGRGGCPVEQEVSPSLRQVGDVGGPPRPGVLTA